MTMNRERPFEDIVAQLEDPDNWMKTNSEDVLRVARVFTVSELQLQMHLWATKDPEFSPSFVVGAMTALNLDWMAHRDEVRFSTGR